MYFRPNEILSNNALAEPTERRWSALGEPAVGKPKSIVLLAIGEDVPLRHFECPADALPRIKAVTGITMTAAEVSSRIRFQAGNAAGVATEVAKRLLSPDATAVSAFQNTFGVSPDAFPSTLPRSGAWNWGRIVRQRFLGAHRLLKSGALLYSCWGRPRIAGGPETSPDYLVLAQPSQYWIALGRLYWEATRKGDVDTTTHAFLLAALRAYYGPLLSDASGMAVPLRVFDNLHCHLQFAISLFNANLPDWVDANCSKTA